MPKYIIISTSETMTIVDITHDDGTVRKSVGFKHPQDFTYTDADDLQTKLAAAVQANQDTHYALKAKAAVQADVDKLVGKTVTVKPVVVTPTPVVVPKL